MIKTIASILPILIFVHVFWGCETNQPAKKITIRDVDCANIPSILDEVYEIDQGIRIADTVEIDYEEMERLDHQNLETIASIIEKCGMPTLANVDKVQMVAIWLVLQHSHYDHIKTYFSYIEKAVKNGDLSKEYLALMTDRMLMWEDKPQIYGSQVLDGKLYTLEDPSNVNARRAAMGMEPIEAYLERFGIVYQGQ